MLMLLLLATLAANAPVLDGTIGPDEWNGAERRPLKGGGEVLLLPRGDVLYVALRSPANGIASLCTGDADRVAILHASAALGTAEYARDGETWRRKADFKYEIRENANEEARAKHLATWEWLANPNRAGAPVREFAINLTDARRFLAVAFVTNDGAVAYWPETVRDDCAALKLGQGWTGETQAFAPATWYPLPR